MEHRTTLVERLSSRGSRSIELRDDLAGIEPSDPAELMLTCANCGARMDERKCKLVCRCGYFLSCSDYY